MKKLFLFLIIFCSWYSGAFANISTANYYGNYFSIFNNSGTYLTSVSGTYPNTVTFDGSNFWGGGDGGNLYEYSTGGNLLNTYGIGNFNSLAFDGTYIWGGNSSNNNLVKISTSGTIITTYTGWGNCSGLVFDGVSMWCLYGGGGGYLRKFNISDASIISTISYAGDYSAISFDSINDNIWIGEGNYIKVYDLGSNLLNTFSGLGFIVSIGMYFDGTNMQISGLNTVYTMNLSGTVLNSWGSSRPWGIATDYFYSIFVPSPPADTGTPISPNGFSCKAIDYPIFTSTPYIIGSGTYTDNSSGATIPDQYNFQWTSTDGSYADYFTVNHTIGLYLDTDTFTGGLSAGKTTTIYSGIDAIDAGNPTTLAVALVRSGQNAILNYVKIKTNNIGFNSINSNQKNVVANVIFSGIDGGKYTYPLTYSGGYATALSRFPSNYAKIEFIAGTVTFDGFEVGYSNSGSLTKVSCKNNDFQCQFTQQSPGIFTCDSALNVSGIAQGVCQNLIITGIDTCLPVTGTIPYYDGAIVPGGAVEQAINSSGAIVGLQYNEEDIFSCNETGLAVLICPFHVISNVWGKFTFVIKKLVNLIYGISSLGSPSGTGNIFSFVFPVTYAGGIELATPFDISGSGTSHSTYTGNDIMNLNKTILHASDNVYSMNSAGIKGIYAFSMWFLILVGIVGIIVIFLTAFH